MAIGIDDIGSMIDWLYGDGVTVSCRFNGEKFKKREKLIKYIEDNDLKHLLIEKTEKKWFKIEGAFTDEVKKRKQRF